MEFSLLAVGDHRRAGSLKALDGVADGRLVQRIEPRIGAVADDADRLDQLQRARNTADRLGGESHWNHRAAYVIASTLRRPSRPTLSMRNTMNRAASGRPEIAVVVRLY